MNKAIILARVSTKEQEEGHSLPAQIRRLKEYADKKEFTVVEEFAFSESAGTKIRKKFLEMLQYLRDHQDVKVVLCQNVDRITRNFKDAVDLDDMRINEGLEIHFVQDGFYINREATGNQMFMWEAKVFLAKQYLNRLSDDVKRSVEQKIRNGEWIGKSHIGYKNVDLEDGKKWVFPDPERADLIKKLFEWYATGNYSMELLRKKVKEEGLTNNTESKTALSRSMIEHILKNPFYYGEMRLKGKTYPHNYEPLITKELFDTVQQVIENWHKKPFQHAAKPFVFRGLLKCASCGCTITFEMKKGKYTYGHCTNHYGNCPNDVWVKEETLTSQVEEILKGLEIPEKALSWLTEALRSSHKDKRDYYERITSNLQAEYSRLETRIEKMYEDLLDGRITQEFYDKKFKEYKDKQNDIHLQVERHSKADETYYIEATKVLELASKASQLFENADLEEKRDLLKYLFQNSTWDGKRLDITLQKPFDLILSHAKTGNWLPG